MHTSRIALAVILVALGISGVALAQTATPTLYSGTCQLETDRVYKAPDESAVYYVSDDCKRRAFKNPELFFSYFESWSDVITDARIRNIADHELGFMPFGPRIALKLGFLAKTVDDPNVYFLTETDRGQEWTIVNSEAAFLEQGFDWSWIQDVDPRVIESRQTSADRVRVGDDPPVGAVLKFGASADLYQVERVGGIRRLLRIPDEETFRDRGLRFDRVAMRDADDRVTIDLNEYDAPSIRLHQSDDSNNSSLNDLPDGMTGNPMDKYSYTNTDTGTRVHIWIDGNMRYITANGIPDHETGDFPNANNPYEIKPQKYVYQIPLPNKDTKPTHKFAYTVRGSYFGVALNGVPFDPNSGEWYKDDPTYSWEYEPISRGASGIDTSNAHVKTNGAYHYHGIPEGFISTTLFQGKDQTNEVTLLGFAADGFPIYSTYGYDENMNIIHLKPSYRLRPWITPSKNDPPGAHEGIFYRDYEYDIFSGDLDKCNGRKAPTPEFPEGIYHYVLTDTYPFIPRCFAEEPDKSFYYEQKEVITNNTFYTSNANDSCKDLSINDACEYLAAPTVLFVGTCTTTTDSTILACK